MTTPTIDILYEEGPCLAVCKPAGLLTQAPTGIDSMERRIKDFLIWRENKPGKAYLGIPHRLDRGVSGAIVFAKHVRAARRLSEQFEARTVKKIYWACVSGKVAPAEGTWTDFTRKLPGRAEAEIVAPDHPEGREAVLHYRTLSEASWGTWLEIELETGRMHQVRIQASTHGHPVLGDSQYGSEQAFGPQHEDHRLRAIALHARSLSFRHAMTHENVTVVAPLSDAWQQLNLPAESDVC